MKTTLIILLLIPIIKFSSCEQNDNETVEKKDTEIKEYKTQTELNIERYETVLDTEKKLDSIYNKIKELYKSDEGTFLLDLEKSQDLWLKYLEAQMIVKYPKNITAYKFFWRVN